MNEGIKLLCVDDDAIGLYVRRLVLESQGYRVFTAGNGREALNILARETIALVILDYSMPGMDGGVVAQKMRDLKPAVPILMLSAYVDLPGETLALVDRSITKGQLPTLMLAEVAGLVRAGPSVRTRSAA